MWNHSLSLSPDTTSQLQFNNKVYARAPSCRDLVPPEITFTPGTTSPTNTLRSVCIESDLFRSQPQGCQRAALVVFRLQHRQRRRTSMRSLKREEGWSRGSGLPGQVAAFLLLCSCSTEGVCRQAAFLDISIHEMILSKAPVWGWRKVRLLWRRRRVRATTTSTLPGPSSSDLTITPQTLYGLHPSRFNQGA